MADADNPDGRVYTFDSASLTADTIEFQNHPEVISFEDIQSIICVCAEVNAYFPWLLHWQMLIRSSDKEMLAMLEEKEKRRMAKSSTNSEPKAEVINVQW